MRAPARMLVLWAVLSPFHLSAQSIFTFAGGINDDGRPASVAALRNPGGIASDADGNLYFADTDSNRIRRIDQRNGIITTVAGNGSYGFSGDGGLATQASLAAPSDVTVDRAGNLYIADTYNVRVRKVDAATGAITTYAGIGEGGYSGDGGPATAARISLLSGVTVDAAGHVFIADTFNSTIRKIDRFTKIISTVAGVGSPGYSGDSGAATAAALKFPRDLAFDREGALIIADTGNHVIRKVNASMISTIAGTGSSGFSGDGSPAVNARMNSPYGVATDELGFIYISDSFNSLIRLLSPDGIISTFAGNRKATFSGDAGPATLASLSFPTGVTPTPSGDLVLSDSANQRLRKISGANRMISTIAGNGTFGAFGDGGPATFSRLIAPYGVAVDSKGDLFIADTDEHLIRKVDRVSGLISTVAGDGFDNDPIPGEIATETSLPSPFAVAVSSSGHLYVASGSAVFRIEAASRVVTLIAGNGSFSHSGDGGPATRAGLPFPVDLAFDANDNLYIVDQFDHRVRKVDHETQIITTFAGNGKRAPGLDNGTFSGDNGPATLAGLSFPTGIAIDGAGNVYIADSGNQRVRRVDAATRTITTFAGNGSANFGGDHGPATAASLASPADVAVDSQGHVFVVDGSHHRIRKISSETSLIETIAGTGVIDASGDGGPATGAGLAFPESIAIDRGGNVFIADTSNDRIRVVFACASVGSPALLFPSPNAMGERTARSFTWRPVPGALSYDLYLDTKEPPEILVAEGLRSPRFGASLLHDVTYFWRVVARGDTFCPERQSSTSETRMFRTRSECTAPGEVSGMP